MTQVLFLQQTFSISKGIGLQTEQSHHSGTLSSRSGPWSGSADSLISACSRLLLMTRKSTGVSIHYNFDCFVLARRSLSSTRAAAGAFYWRIFTWTARSFSSLFTATRILTGTGLQQEKTFAIVNRRFSRKWFLVLHVHVENVVLSLPLDSRSPKAKRQSEMMMRPIPRFFGCVVQQAIRIHLRVLDPSVSTFTLVSWSISSIFNAVDADLLTFTSRHAVRESRCRLQNNNRGAQGIVVERDPLSFQSFT